MVLKLRYFCLNLKWSEVSLQNTSETTNTFLRIIPGSGVLFSQRKITIQVGSGYCCLCDALEVCDQHKKKMQGVEFTRYSFTNAAFQFMFATVVVPGEGIRMGTAAVDAESADAESADEASIDACSSTGVKGEVGTELEGGEDGDGRTAIGGTERLSRG